MAEKKFQHAAADVAGVECRIYQTEISSEGGTWIFMPSQPGWLCQGNMMDRSPKT